MFRVTIVTLAQSTLREIARPLDSSEHDEMDQAGIGDKGLLGHLCCFSILGSSTRLAYETYMWQSTADEMTSMLLSGYSAAKVLHHSYSLGGFGFDQYNNSVSRMTHSFVGMVRLSLIGGPNTGKKLQGLARRDSEIVSRKSRMPEGPCGLVKVFGNSRDHKPPHEKRSNAVVYHCQLPTGRP